MADEPQLSGEWHPTKNGGLRPKEVARCALARVWWRCAAGHEWQAAPKVRARGHGCPFCSGNRVSPELSLAALAPELAREWHGRRNGALRPTQVTPGSSRRTWWRCAMGHEWQASPWTRSKGHGCPYCSGKRTTADMSLAAAFPRLAREWHPHQNGVLRPTELRSGSHKRVWWKCRAGHEWVACVSSRSHGTGCPYCAGKHATTETSLAAHSPDLAREWHPTKNGALRPVDVTHGSGKRVWWKCSAAHEWQATIVGRCSGDGCPFCAGRRVCSTNSLATLFPDLATDWHPTKNRTLTPHDVTRGSHRRVWWRCPNGHSWNSTVYNRTGNPSAGCPICREAAKPRKERAKKRAAGRVPILI